MGDVSKHYTELKWKCNYRKKRRINFFVSWHSISIDNLLKDEGEFISLYVCRRGFVYWEIVDLLHLSSGKIWVFLINILNALIHFIPEKVGHPNMAVKNVILNLEGVHSVVNRLFSENI